jgi:hypothetical protein
MKPNTKLYVYFDNINVSDICLNLSTYVGTWSTIGGNYIATNGSYIYIAYDGSVYSHTNNWGGQITSDSYGNVYGIFKIPANTFKSGELEFKLTDISKLAQGESAVTTEAVYNMFCSALSVQKQKFTPTPTVRPPQQPPAPLPKTPDPPTTPANPPGKQWVPDYIRSGLTPVPNAVGVAVDKTSILAAGDRRPVVAIDSKGYIQVSGFTETWAGGGNVLIDYKDPNNIYTGWGNPDLTYYYL